VIEFSRRGAEEKAVRRRPQDVGDTWAHQERSARVITQIPATLFELRRDIGADFN